jgi:hypothetical protein
MFRHAPVNQRSHLFSSHRQSQSFNHRALLSLTTMASSIGTNQQAESATFIDAIGCKF